MQRLYLSMPIRRLHTPPLTSLQQQLLNDFQRDFPLSPTPYADIAAKLGISEAEVLENLRVLSEVGVVSRVGPVFRPHCIGVSTLAALKVPPAQLPEIAAYISTLPAVNHNYEREHPFNLWFVVTAVNEQALQKVLQDIEEHTGLSVLSLPMLADYHIDLGFNLRFDK